MARFQEHLATALEQGLPFAVGIISGAKGSSPQKRGAKALFLADGRILGTLGGGCLEAEVQDRARRALLSERPAKFDLVLDHVFGWDDGLICGGSVSGLILPVTGSAAGFWRELAAGTGEACGWGVRDGFLASWLDDSAESGWLYRESVPAPTRLWIAGSGHVAQAVAPLAAQLEFAVTVFDDRPSMANERFFPPGTRLRVGSWERLLREAPPAAGAFGLIVTRGHQHDALVLREWVHQPFSFLGMIGSRRKWRLISEEFLAGGVASPEQLGRVRCPVGLDIGAVSVPEIALSTVAQLVQTRAALLTASDAT